MPSRFSYQLYTSREHGPIEATLAMIAKHGYKEVEGFDGVYGDPAKLKMLLESSGVAMPSGHFGIEVLEKKKGKALATARTLGISKIIVPYIPADQRPRSAKGWKDFGKRLNAIAKTYRGEGFSVAWHNHDFEFVPGRDGVTPHEHIFSNAPLLDWEIDVAWIIRGKTNPLPWIKRYAATITLAHVKDIATEGENMDEEGWADIGHGVMKWKAYMAALHETKCMHWIIEHDKPSDDDRFAKRSIAAARKL